MNKSTVVLIGSGTFILGFYTAIRLVEIGLKEYDVEAAKERRKRRHSIYTSY